MSNLRVADAEAALRDFEIRHDVLQFQLDGWCVWPLLRLLAGYTLQGATAISGAGLRPSQRASAFGHDLLHLNRLRRRRYLVKTYVSGLVDLEDGKYRDIWFGDLVRELPDALQIDGINSPALLARRARSQRPGDFTSALIDTTAAVLARVHAPRGVAEIAGELAALLQASFDQERFSRAWVEGTLRRFLVLKNLYGRLLQRVRPETVLVADFGEHALVAAAREWGARTLELQHGLVYPEHHGYGWTTYALPYRSRMPLPDSLVLYGEHWKRELDINGFWGDRLDVAGSLRVDAYRARRSRRESRDGPVILVTSQGIDTDRLMQFLASYLAQENDPGVRLVVKLHPVFEPDKAAVSRVFRGDPRVSVLLAGEGGSTFDLLVGADLHLSISSTCHYEALGLGVPTAILPFSSHEVMLPLREAGHARLLHEPADLRELIRSRDALRVDAAVGAYYFEPGALENLRALLERGSGLVQERAGAAMAGANR